jgi:SAM-dependent methyltransferase
METSIPFDRFDSVYEARSAPWLIGQPQPAVVGLEREGWIRGAVLDAGCGAGEHTIHLARLGYDVLGIDFSPRAVEQARENAAARDVPARFEVANALDLGDAPRFDTIIDSALFNIFSAEDRAAYVRSLRAVCRPGGLVHLLALSDAGPRVGPQVSETMIREAFREGWVVEELVPSRYRIVVDAEKGARLGARPGELADAVAWLARIRR